MKWPSNHTTGHIAWENHNSKDTCILVFSAALFTIARTWEQPRCPSTHEWIKNIWWLYAYIYIHTHIHTYNGIWLSHKKEQIWNRWRRMNKPTACYTEWSKSEREKQVLRIRAYIWNLEKWYWGTYLQSRSRDSDIENRLVDTAGTEKVGWTERVALILMYITMCKTAS